MFASVGADGSVRMFDLRHLEHSTIIYEDPQHHPLLRLSWNKQDPNYLATMAMDSLEVNAAPFGLCLFDDCKIVFLFLMDFCVFLSLFFPFSSLIYCL